MEKKTTVLVIDDSNSMQKIIELTLSHAGYTVHCAQEGCQGLRMAASVKPDIIVLDLSLPDMDGLEVLKNLRDWSQTPIIACSLRNEDVNIIETLMAGADDFMPKPFNPDVLIAKIYANLRRAAKVEAGKPILVNGLVEMDLISHEVKLAGINQKFTPKQYDLLRYFIINKGKILTHRAILRDVWGPAHVDDSQYLRIYVRDLRKKIELDPSKPQYFSTITGVGYKMENMNG